MPKTESNDIKRNLRKKFLNLRDDLEPSEKLGADAKISSALESLLIDCNGPIGFYWPMRNEYDPVHIILKWLRKKNRYAALPVIIEKRAPMKFLSWDINTKLEKGFFDLSVPPINSSELSPTVIVIPCVGFDSKNYRLGYGGGYYDRTLIKYPNAKKIGISYKSCKTDNLYPNEYDIPMDFIICS